MISQQSIQQIQSRIDIIDVVGSYVKLKKRGANYLGLCPFHNEKSPSFTVSPVKEIYKCFGCGKSGNTIGFLMEHDKLSYVEALRWLAAKYNVELEETQASPEFRMQQQVADSLYIINNFARDFFSTSLFQSDEGRDIALTYLKQRGFREEIINRFQLGFNPMARDEFAQAAISAQYSKELLLKSGTVVERDERLVDNYRGRIIFPIHNTIGKISGFGARLIKSNEKAPKYINTPENEIYIKSKILYGAYFAKKAIDNADECLLVEGYTDVVSLHQAGIENVVASGGTSLTADQLKLIKKYTNNLTIIYDGDSAGVKAALRGLDLALTESLNVSLVLIPDKEDPDSYLNKIGAEAFTKFIRSEKKDWILFQLEMALKDAGNDNNKKSQVVNQVAETISKINKTTEFTKRQDYIRQVAEILRIDETGMHALVNQFLREKILKDESGSPKDFGGLPTEAPAAVKKDEVSDLLQQDKLHEEALVRSLIEFGMLEWNQTQKVASFLFNEMEDNELEQMIDSTLLVDIIRTYKKWFEEGLEPTAKSFLYGEDQQMNAAIIDIMYINTDISPNWKKHYEGHIPTRADYFREEVISTLNYLKLRKVKRMIKENDHDLEKEIHPEKQLIYLQTQMHLKAMEKEITRQAGTVIY